MLKQLLWTAALLTLFPFVGSAQNVYITNQYNFDNCSGVGCFLARDLIVPPGSYVVNAKLAVRNLDGDGQFTRCVLYAYPLTGGAPAVVDRTDVRIPGGDSIQQAVALQGVAQSGTDRGLRFMVQCNGFNAEAQELVITAIRLAPGSFIQPQNYAPFPFN